MICPECNGMGETVYYVEIDRDENSITVEQRKDICQTCNGSGKKLMTNADRIRIMSDEELAKFLNWCEAMGYEDSSIAIDSSGHCMDMLEWLQQPAPEEDKHD